MTDDEIYLGITLALLLATGSQILASKCAFPRSSFCCPPVSRRAR